MASYATGWVAGRASGLYKKLRVVGCLSAARCRLAYGPADATATHVSCFSKIQIGFTFQVPAHLGSPGKKAVKRVHLFNSNIFRVPTG